MIDKLWQDFAVLQAAVLQNRDEAVRKPLRREMKRIVKRIKVLEND